MNKKTPVFSSHFVDEMLRKQLVDFRKNPEIGQATEEALNELIHQIQKKFIVVYKSIAEEANKSKNRDENKDLMSVPMFDNTSHEINVMARLEFIMSLARGAEELDEPSQSRIASWFVSKFGDNFW